MNPLYLPTDLPPLFAEPPALAREHWGPLRARLEKVDLARAKQHEYEVEAIRLRDELPAARERDRQRLGQALTAGDPEPESEAPRLEQELERAGRNSLALNSAIAEAIDETSSVVDRSRGEWAEDLERRLT